jgi:hypothetical protein
MLILYKNIQLNNLVIFGYIDYQYKNISMFCVFGDRCALKIKPGQFSEQNSLSLELVVQPDALQA